MKDIDGPMSQMKKPPQERTGGTRGEKGEEIRTNFLLVPEGWRRWKRTIVFPSYSIYTNIFSLWNKRIERTPTVNWSGAQGRLAYRAELRQWDCATEWKGRLIRTFRWHHTEYRTFVPAASWFASLLKKGQQLWATFEIHVSSLPKMLCSNHVFFFPNTSLRNKSAHLMWWDRTCNNTDVLGDCATLT